MKNSNFDLQALQLELSGKNPRTVLKAALGQFDNIAISFSGAEDVVLIDMALQINPEIQVFTLDTGRLHSETYEFIEKIRNHYNLKLEMMAPEATSLETLVKQKGLFSFYQDGHGECCGIRKVEPLQRKLSQLDAWITGQRKDQNKETRDLLPEVEFDPTFSSDNHCLIKFNPICNWTSNQVWDYIEAYQVPFNELHRHGFRSIGCQPCTRPTLPSQHERDGRWWWEDAAKKECGLHAGNLSKSD